MPIKNHLQFIALIIIAGLAIGLPRVWGAWQEPSMLPPAGNVPAPINVSPNPQTKAGNLGLGGASADAAVGLIVSGATGIRASNSTGLNYCTIGDASTGISCQANNAGFNAGVYGVGINYGVFGYSDSIGVYGENANGNMGFLAGPDYGAAGVAVDGANTHEGYLAYKYGGRYSAVYGYSSDPNAWAGYFKLGHGIAIDKSAFGTIIAPAASTLIHAYQEAGSGKVLLEQSSSLNEISYNLKNNLGEYKLALTGQKLEIKRTSGWPTDMMTITNLGNVGIRNVNPNVILTIAETPGTSKVFQANGQGQFDINSNNGADQALVLANPNTSAKKVALDFQAYTPAWVLSVARIAGAGEETGGSGALAFYTSSSGTMAEKMRIRSNGNVGIGTINPSYKLQVNGSVAGIGPYNEVSDIRYKTNIVDLSNSLDKLMALRGVEYDWRLAEFPDQQFPAGRQLGLIAQEVQSIFPQAVSIDDNGYLSVAYSRLIPVLIEAIKEQQAQIQDLREEVNELRRLIGEIKKVD